MQRAQGIVMLRKKQSRGLQSWFNDLFCYSWLHSFSIRLLHGFTDRSKRIADKHTRILPLENPGNALTFLGFFIQLVLLVFVTLHFMIRTLSARFGANYKSGIAVALVNIPLSLALSVASLGNYPSAPLMGILTAIW